MNSSVSANAACRRFVAVSKMALKRTRRLYSVRNAGICANSFSSFCRSSSVRLSGSRRISHISERNSFRSARDNFALCARVIFFSQPVEGFIPQLGHVKSVDHATSVRQSLLARLVERRAHVHAVAVHLLALLEGQALQAGPSGRFVPPGLHRQQARSLRIGQIGQHRHVQLVPLLQADLIHANVANHPRRVDGLGILQLVLDDATDRLGRDAQAPRNVRFRAADQQVHDVLLESIGVAGVFPLERRDQILTMVAAGTAMKDAFINPEARLAAYVEVPHHARFAALLQAGLILVPATLTSTALGPSPRDLEAVALAAAFVRGEFPPFGQIDVDGDAGHSRPWQQVFPSTRSTGRTFQLSTIESPCQRGNPRIPWVLHLKAEEPNRSLRDYRQSRALQITLSLLGLCERHGNMSRMCEVRNLRRHPLGVLNKNANQSESED